MNVLFVKYTNRRKKEFQIVTQIIEEGGHVFVEKKAYSASSIKHIYRIQASYERLKKIYTDNNLAKLVSVDEGVIRMEYVEGESLKGYLCKCLDEYDLDSFNLEIEKFVAFIKENNEYAEFLTDFSVKDSGMIELDLNFDNIIVKPDGSYVICDYEWPVDCITSDFAVWRAVHYFFIMKATDYPIMGEKEVLDNLGISMGQRKQFLKYEAFIQNYINDSLEEKYHKKQMVVDLNRGVGHLLKKVILSKFL